MLKTGHNRLGFLRDGYRRVLVTTLVEVLEAEHRPGGVVPSGLHATEKSGMQV
jgi:hypothetical protein